TGDSPQEAPDGRLGGQPSGFFLSRPRQRHDSATARAKQTQASHLGVRGGEAPARRQPSAPRPATAGGCGWRSPRPRRSRKKRRRWPCSRFLRAWPPVTFVEVAGIEPASFSASPGLLRAQPALDFLSPGVHAGKSPTGSVTVWCPAQPRDRAGQLILLADARRRAGGTPGLTHFLASGYQAASWTSVRVTSALEFCGHGINEGTTATLGPLPLDRPPKSKPITPYGVVLAGT